jgi:UDP-N-acetylglucosamine 2-epimerase (non-hydrolysing)
MKLLSIVGARPNFVKIAPLTRELRRYPDIVSILVHTGQHYDGPMSDQFFTDLEIPRPDFNLGVGSGTHTAQTAEVMRRLEPVLNTTRPDLALVVGDVNSTLAGALTAVKLGIPVAHVEAGLRSFDRTMPEEINRLLTDQISELLFVSEDSGRTNLLREGISPEKIHFVGNVMIDALEASRPKWETSDIFERLGVERSVPYAVLTLHRPSNVDDVSTLVSLLDELTEIARQIPIIFPVHPRTQQQLKRDARFQHTGKDAVTPLGHKGIAYVEPLSYLDFVALMSRARLVLTDSGGIQEETTMLGVPCLTLRDNTERPVTVSHGTNRVIGSRPHRVSQEALDALAGMHPSNGPPPLWDGRAATRIVKVLVAMRPALTGS